MSKLIDLNGLKTVTNKIKELIKVETDRAVEVETTLSNNIEQLGNSIENMIENLDLSGYQTVNDENLSTESKNIVNAINEVNNKVGSFSSQAENIINDINDML